MLILSQICAHVQAMLARKSKSLKDVVTVLKVFRDNVDEDALAIDDNGQPAPSQAMILEELIKFLESILKK